MKSSHRFERFARRVAAKTIFFRIIGVFTALWLLFSLGLFLSEQRAADSTIITYWDALYWGVAAFSTAGIANVPRMPLSHLIGGIWIVLGSVLFFGTIVSVVTAYFMRPLNRPRWKMVDSIVTGLEQLDDLTDDETTLLEAEIDCLFKQIKNQRSISDSARETVSSEKQNG